MLIALDDIDIDPNNVRKLAASYDAERALQDSIAALGVLQPILVREQGDRYVVIAGARRVAAARALKMTRIPAEVFQASDNEAVAAAAAENMVRAKMDAVDQWKAIERLQAQGYTLQGAAQALGLSENLARRMTKMASLHPKVLSAIAGRDLPSMKHLSIVAAAPLELQKRAMEQIKKECGEIDWHYIATKCKVPRISRAHAIFDTANPKTGISWDEDLFAEPGSPDQFTTTDIKRFLELQTEALTRQVRAAQQRNEAIQIAPFDGGRVHLVPPPGWDVSYERVPKKAPKVGGDRMILTGVYPSDYHTGQIAEVLAIMKPTRKRSAAKAPALASSGDEPEEGAGRPPINTIGLDLLADDKSVALHKALRAPGIPMDQMLALVVIALSAQNVGVRGYDRDAESEAGGRPYIDLARRLLLPGGQLATPGAETLVAIAGEALARTLWLTGPKAALSSYSRNSGDAAEWIGHAIGADGYLSRCDTPDFLATVSGAALRELCKTAGVKPATVAEMRRNLVGKLPAWRPAAFGAPAAVKAGEVMDGAFEDAFEDDAA